MKDIIGILIILFLINTCFAQPFSYEFNSKEFEDIIVTCRDADITKESECEISLDTYFKFFKEEPDYENIVSVSCRQLLNVASNITLIVEINRPQGGYTSTIQLATFSSNEVLVKKDFVGYNSMGMDGGSYCTINFYDDRLLEINQEEIEYIGADQEMKKILSDECIYYSIDGKGYFKLTPNCSKNRLFPDASMRVLTKEEIDSYSSDDLDIMRNEIFADHGYVFKSVKWSNYFKNQSWYIADSTYSEDRLTLIEKYNIERILTVNE